MLILKGDSGKGRLVEAIKVYNGESLCISIGENNLLSADYKISKDDIVTAKELKEFLSKSISEDCRYIIFYSNLTEQDIKPFIKIAKELEYQLNGLIWDCIVMHK